MRLSTRLVVAVGPAIVATSAFAPIASAAIAYNPIVARVGDGVNTSSQRGYTTTLVEYQAGSPGTVLSSTVYNNDTNNGVALVNTMSQRREAYLSNNPALLDNALKGLPTTSGYVFNPGYNTSNNGTSSAFSSSSSSNFDRSFGYATVGNGVVSGPTIALTVPQTQIYGNNTFEGLTGTDTATGFYAAGNGSNSGARYVDATPTNVQLGGSGERRSTEIYKGKLWASTGSGLNVFNTVTLPTAASTETSVLTSTGTAGEFVVFDDPTNSVDTTNSFGVDTIYMADEGAPVAGGLTGGGIRKYVWSGTAWSQVYSLNAENLGLTVGMRGLAGAWDPDLQKMVLFATDAQGASLPSSLYQVTDLGAGPASPFTLLATSGTATAFRGVALVPASVPEPASVGLLGLGIAGLVVRRRK